MCFVQTVQNLRLIARLRGHEESMNALGSGKTKKFIAQFHFDPKNRSRSSFRYGKLRLWQRMITPKIHIFFRSVLIFLLCSLCNVSAMGDVDVILVNGNIYTVNEKQPHA